jgi:hypothetical protein
MDRSPPQFQVAKLIGRLIMSCNNTAIKVEVDSACGMYLVSSFLSIPFVFDIVLHHLVWLYLSGARKTIEKPTESHTPFN